MGVTHLLDTHALVWAVSAPDRLSDRARSAIAEPASHLVVSAATAWELATKVRLGKFAAAEPLVDQYDRVIERLGASHLPIDQRHARRAGSLTWGHRDPFDRMLAAQAMLEHLTLVTTDAAFDGLPGIDVLW